MNLFEDDRPRKAVAAQPGEKLDDLSVSELQARVELYSGEIERLKAEIAAKEKSRHAAESFFRI